MEWILFFFGTEIYNQLHCGLRKRVGTVERIDSFFSDELCSDLGESIENSEVALPQLTEDSVVQVKLKF
jgi:hypothetical protein